MRTVSLMLSLLISPWLATQASASYLQHPEVNAYIDSLSAEHALDKPRLRALFGQISPQDSVLAKMAKPAERTLDWKAYQRIFLKPDRVAQGVAFMQEHADLLARAEAEYGVPPEIITAIIGVETKYGRITGSHPVFASVATLAFDYPPRSRFFRKELTEFLLFTEEEDIDPLAVQGSYAGAMGMAQFISSSYRRYAVDFDADGKRDLWGSTADAIGSVANYFHVHRWQPNEAVVERVAEPSKQQNYRQLLSQQLKPAVARGALEDVGIPVVGDSVGKLRLFTLQGTKGEELWIGHHNFYVITRYNHSQLYAMAVYQLSQQILAGAAS